MFYRDIPNEYPIEVNAVKLITCHLPSAYIEGIEKLVENEVYPNRSEAIRVAIRDLLKNELGHLVKDEAQ
jgi:antitoxin ParD1/3/4